MLHSAVKVARQSQTGRNASQLAIDSTITKLQKWADQTIQQLALTNHLSKNEKKEVVGLVQQQQADLLKFANSYGGRGFTISVEYVAQIIDLILQYQFHLNQRLQWYELPTYPLPKSIQRSKALLFSVLTSTAIGNAMAPQIPIGASFLSRLVERKRWLRTKGVVVLVYHHDLSAPLWQIFGRLAHIDKDRLYLIFDHSKTDYISIPLYRIAFLFEVQSIRLSVH